MSGDNTHGIAGRPWHALGFAAGLLIAIIMSIVEWLTLGSGSGLDGGGDTIKFLATCVTVYGFVTVPIGLGFGLSLSGFSRWLQLPESWQKLSSDAVHRRKHERNLAAIAVLIPVMAVGLAGFAFFVQRSFVHTMNNPLYSGGFMALAMLAGVAGCVGLFGAGVVIVGATLPKIGVRLLARREPRLLRGALHAVALVVVMGLAGSFVVLYNPEVWKVSWVGFLFAATLGPPLLTVSGPLIGWAKFLRGRAAMGSLLLGYLALSAGTFTGLNSWEGPAEAMGQHTTFGATIGGLIHQLTDMDGDGRSALLAGGDCDDSNPAVYPGALEIPGNGIDDNCLNGDASATASDPLAPTLVGPGPGTEISEGSGAAQLPELEPEPLPVDHRRNVVIILVDTLRPDHLGFYGYTRDEIDQLTPQIDALARESLVFDRAYAQAPRTPGSIPSLFTSRFPSHIDFENPTHNYPILRESNVTLFEALQEQGYYTLGVSSHYYFEEDQGMTQGFDFWDNRGATSISETNTAIQAPEIFAHLEEHTETLLNREEPWALFVHYFEPHSRWLAHPEIVEFPRADSGRQRHIDKYDSEIAFVDGYVGLTIDWLRENGFYDDGIIVFVSDHGEAFNEHGHFFHGQSLYEEVTRVPFFLRVPGMEHARIEVPVALLDVAPTVLGLIGADPPSEFEGLTLLENYPAVPARPIISELLPYTNNSEHLTAIVDGMGKLVYHVGERRHEYYDLANDPGEQNNNYRGNEAAERLEQTLIQWLEGS